MNGQLTQPFLLLLSTFEVQTALLLQVMDEVYQLTVEVEHFHPALCQETYLLEI